MVELLDDGVSLVIPLLSAINNNYPVEHKLEDGAKREERAHPRIIILAAGSPGIALQVVDRLVAVSIPVMTTLYITEPMSLRPVQVQRSTAATGAGERFPASVGRMSRFPAYTSGAAQVLGCPAWPVIRTAHPSTHGRCHECNEPSRAFRPRVESR